MSRRAPPPQSLLDSIPQRGALQRREPAPVEQWDTPLSGEMDMRIARDGTWYHEGDAIERKALAQLFSSILRLDEDGRYYLVTPSAGASRSMTRPLWLPACVSRDRASSSACTSLPTWKTT